MPNAWQINCLRARMRSLEAEIRRVAEKDHPYPEPDVIYNALVSVVRSRIDLFEEALDLFLGSEEYERDLQATFGTVARDLQRVAEEFSLADRVDSARIPFELLRALSWAANILLDENCRTVVRLDTTYTYTISSCRQRFEGLGWTDHWDASVNTDRFTVLVLGFPSSDANSILLHALAAHEFGHRFIPRYKSSLLALRDRLAQDVKGEYGEQLKDYLLDNVVKREGVARGDAYEESRKLVEARLLKLGEYWLSEILSDLVAARLVGPAFLPALDRILLGLGRPSPTHPPGHLRKHLVREYLGKLFPELVEDSIWMPFFSQHEDLALSRATDEQGQGDAWQPLYQVGERMCRLGLEPISSILETCPCTFEKVQQYALAKPAASNRRGERVSESDEAVSA